MYEKDYFTWTEVEALIKQLVQQIQDKGIQFNSISTVSRGGLVPARLVADRMNIKKILVDKETIPSDSLSVDDIFDTGKTFEKIISKAENSDNLVYATIFKRKNKPAPNQLIFAKETRADEYIVYPWDRFEHNLVYEM